MKKKYNTTEKILWTRKMLNSGIEPSTAWLWASDTCHATTLSDVLKKKISFTISGNGLKCDGCDQQWRHRFRRQRQKTRGEQNSPKLRKNPQVGKTQEEQGRSGETKSVGRKMRSQRSDRYKKRRWRRTRRHKTPRKDVSGTRNETHDQPARGQAEGYANKWKAEPGRYKRNQNTKLPVPACSQFIRCVHTSSLS